jgi:hypothetical protein
MKRHRYEVYFFSKFIVLYAFNEKEAKILAQARMINDGLDYTVNYVTELK